MFLMMLGCTTAIESYKDSSPALDIKKYFNGELIAWGMVQDYRNKVTRRFCVELVGKWQENKGILAETFYFDDGEISFRNWQLTKLSTGQYIGQAEDVIGQASGQQQGFGFHWQYVLLVDFGNKSYQFQMDDWMYQLDENRVFNRTTMNKFGIELAEITLFFDKAAISNSCSYKSKKA